MEFAGFFLSTLFRKPKRAHCRSLRTHTLCGHIQGHALYLYIMGDATVPWFGPIPLIGYQGTLKRLTK